MFKKPHSEETKRKISVGMKKCIELKGKEVIYSKERNLKISERMKKNNPSKLTWVREKISKSCIGKKAWNKGVSMREEQRKKLSLIKGNKTGWVTPKNQLIRMSLECKKWRKAIFERDNYTCQVCRQRGFQLNADHIKPFAYFPELRFELSNGRTLCINCHRKTDTYQNKAKKYAKTVV